MISESTALRIAQALERLVAAVEAGQKPPVHVIPTGSKLVYTPAPLPPTWASTAGDNPHDTASYY